MVDIREEFAYGTARIEGAMRIERAKLSPTGKALCKDFPVLFVCGNGRQSRDLAREFCAEDWDAHWLAGGIARWIEDGLPVKRDALPAAASNGVEAPGTALTAQNGGGSIRARIRKTLLGA